MADSLEELKERYKLTPQTIEEILKEIIPALTANASAVDQPKMILLGGQPGAGKTGIQVLAEKELSSNLVICNSDNLRDYHPMAMEIKTRHEKDYPAITAPYAHKWTLGLQQYCREHKLNYILETTMKDGGSINQTIGAIKRHGYQVDIKLMAVNGFLSLLGAFERLEGMRRKENVGRVVSIKDHDDRYRALPGALKEIQEAKLYDNLFIYGRQIGRPGVGEELKLIASNPTDPVTVYLKERDRQWTEEERLIFKDRVADVEGYLRNRRAQELEIQEFRKSLTLPELPKQKLPEQQKQNFKGPHL